MGKYVRKGSKCNFDNVCVCVYDFFNMDKREREWVSERDLDKRITNFIIQCQHYNKKRRKKQIKKSVKIYKHNRTIIKKIVWVKMRKKNDDNI